MVPVFNMEEVKLQEAIVFFFIASRPLKLCRWAESISLRHGFLFHLLFSTGVRIGAVPQLRWEHVLTWHVSSGGESPPPDATQPSGIGLGCQVLEKGAMVRRLCFNEDMQGFHFLPQRTFPDESNPFPSYEALEGGVMVSGTMEPGMNNIVETYGGKLRAWPACLRNI